MKTTRIFFVFVVIQITLCSFTFFITCYFSQLFSFGIMYICCCLVAKLFLTHWDTMDHSLLSSSVHGISQARILEWIAISFSRGSSCPSIEPVSPEFAAGFSTTEPPLPQQKSEQLFSLILFEDYPLLMVSRTPYFSNNLLKVQGL